MSFIKKILALFIILCIVFSFPKVASAANYGDCSYGAGAYGVGCAASPTASASPSPSPSATTSTSNSNSWFNFSNNSTVATPECKDQPPGEKAPWLYSATAVDGDSITLYFAEAGDPVDRYVVQYGTTSGDYPYSALNAGGKGTRTFTVNALNANTTYYFRVRAGNGCATGPWSNELSGKTKLLVSYNQLLIKSSSLDSRNDSTDTSKESAAATTKTATASGQPALTTAGSNVQLKVKVKNDQNSPIEGAQVKLDNQGDGISTDKDGLASFKDVKTGAHIVTLVHDGFTGEQSVNLKDKQNELTMTVEEKDSMISMKIIAIGVALIALFLIGTFFFITYFSREE